MTGMALVAETGTGKTLTYLLPILSKLLANPSSKLLILVPNSTLASQIATVCSSLLQDIPNPPTISTSPTSDNVVITTPGAFLSHHVTEKHPRDRIVSLVNALQPVRWIVTDEADFVLAGGDKPSRELLNGAFRANGMLPSQRGKSIPSNCFFVFVTATLSPIRMRDVKDVDCSSFLQLHFWQKPIQGTTRKEQAMQANPFALDIVKTLGHHRLIPQANQEFEWLWKSIGWKYLKNVPKSLPDATNAEKVSNALIESGVDVKDQIALRELEHEIKLEMIQETCKSLPPGSSVLVFCFSNQQVSNTFNVLQHLGNVYCIQGSTKPPERREILSNFTSPPKKTQVLVASDSLARGLDLYFTHVIQMDMAKDPKMYLHRLGRTARMGKSGTCISFVGLHDIRLAKALNTPENLEFLFRRKQRLVENLKFNEKLPS